MSTPKTSSTTHKAGIDQTSQIAPGNATDELDDSQLDNVSGGAALNRNITTPGGSIRPGQATPPGTTIRPVRS